MFKKVSIVSMDCLRYLLDLLNRGHSFTILYNGDHCIGVNEKKIFDFGNFFKKDLLNRTHLNYIPLEENHSKETVIKVFNLNKKEQEIIEKYFDNSHS